MNEKKLVDNCPSIQLGVSIDGKKGTMNLSSVYESYNYICDIETPENEIVKLYCSHCNSEIVSKTECDLCNAPMIPFDLELGGNVSICSRIGCTNHFVKFVDFSFALKRLYIDAGYLERPYDEDMTGNWKNSVPKNEEDKKIEVIRTGTFLHTYCPYCKKTLIEKGTIKLKVKRNGKSGFLMLSPYLNVFTSKSTILLPENEFIGDIRCFHCDKTLMLTDEKCQQCGSDIARIMVSAKKRLFDFYICSKKGCRWHGLSKEDINDIRLEDSLEW